MKVKIYGIHRNIKRNKGTIYENQFYAKLLEIETNNIIISGTLDYILNIIIERKYELENEIK
jgi:hypothetical protein